MAGAFDDLIPGGGSSATATGFEDLIPAKKQKSGALRRVVGDSAVSLGKGVIGAGETVVGLADIPTLGGVGKAMRAVGYRPDEAKASLESLYSPEQQEAFANVAAAEGAGDTIKALLQNPSVIGQSLVESAPLILGGGALARVARTAAPKLSTMAAGAIGEGAVGAGLSAEQIRQQTENGLLSPKQAALAATIGAGTGLITRAGGAVSKQLGIGDIENLLAGGTTEVAEGAAKKGIPRKLVEGAVAEGLLEEAPQSAQEQLLQNLALDRPAGEGVGKAAAIGGVTGAALGAPVALLGNLRPKGPLAKAASAAGPQPTPAPAPGATPESAAAATPAPGAAVPAAPAPAAPAPKPTNVGGVPINVAATEDERLRSLALHRDLTTLASRATDPANKANLEQMARFHLDRSGFLQPEERPELPTEGLKPTEVTPTEIKVKPSPEPAPETPPETKVEEIEPEDLTLDNSIAALEQMSERLKQTLDVKGLTPGNVRKTREELKAVEYQIKSLREAKVTPPKAALPAPGAKPMDASGREVDKAGSAVDTKPVGDVVRKAGVGRTDTGAGGQERLAQDVRAATAPYRLVLREDGSAVVLGEKADVLEAMQGIGETYVKNADKTVKEGGVVIPPQSVVAARTRLNELAEKNQKATEAAPRVELAETKNGSLVVKGSKADTKVVLGTIPHRYSTLAGGAVVSQDVAKKARARITTLKESSNGNAGTEAGSKGVLPEQGVRDGLRVVEGQEQAQAKGQGQSAAVREEGEVASAPASAQRAEGTSAEEKLPDQPAQRQRDELRKLAQEGLGKKLDADGYSVVDAPSENLARLSKLIKRAFGKDVVFFSAKDDAHDRFNGVASKDGKTVYVNRSVNRPHVKVVFHEVFHALRRTDKAGYRKLVNAMNRGELFKNRDRYRKVSGIESKKKFDEDYVDEEMLADVFAEHATDEKFWKEIAGRVPKTTLQKIVAELGKAISKLKRLLSASKDIEMANYISDMEKVRALLQRFIREGTEVAEDGDAATGTRPAFSYAAARSTNMKEFGLDRSAKNTVRDVGTALSKFVRSRYGKIDRNDRSEKARDTIAKMMVNDYIYETRDAKLADSALGWYTKKWQAAMKLASAAFPELQSDKTARDVLSVITGLTSNNAEVMPNSEHAIEVYDVYSTTGRIASTKATGQTATTIAEALEDFNDLVQKHGARKAVDMLQEMKTVGEWRKEGVNIVDYPVGTQMPRAMIFGPKVGAYTMALLGHPNYLVMDRWWNRTINRYRGNMLPDRTEGILNSVREKLGKPDLTDKQVIAESERIWKQANNDARALRKQGKKTSEAFTPLVRAAKVVVEQNVAGLQDLPMNASDRQFQLDATARAVEMLQSRGIKTSISDVQAVLWYGEKSLFTHLGNRVAEKKKVSYEEAFRDALDRRVGRGSGSIRAKGATSSAEESAGSGPAAFNFKSGTESNGEVQGAERVDDLSGLPSRIFVEGHGHLEFHASGEARRIAQDYAKKYGLDYKPAKTYAKVDPARAKRIADAFEAMQEIGDPAASDKYIRDTLKAYRALQVETMRQYRAIVSAGYKFEFDPEGSGHYANPRLALVDLRDNKHLYVFPTDAGYGSGGKITDEMRLANPLLHKTDVLWGGKDTVVNDIFRAVHDFFGHFKEGVGFRADGEENAWRAHSAMYSPLARKAMTNETRGQNSWVNFGPHGEKNRTAAAKDTVFADQKIGLMPDWVSEEGALDEPGVSFSLKSGWIDGLTPEEQESFRKAGAWQPKATLRDRVKNWSKGWQTRVIQGVVDQFEPIRNLDFKAYMKARLSRSDSNILEGLLQYGTVKFDRDGGVVMADFDNKGFLGVMKELGGEHEQFMSWVVANRAEKLLAEGREHNLTAQDIARIKAKATGTMPDGRNRLQAYQRANVELQRYNKNVMDLAQESGLIDAQTRPLWESEFYVPFYRLAEDTDKLASPTPNKGLMGQYAFKTLKGGTDAVGDPIENTLRNWSHLISASLRNAAAKETLLAAERQGGAIEASEVDAKQMAKSIKSDAVSFVENGVTRWFVLEDPFLVDAMRSIGFMGFKGPAMDTMRNFKNWLTRGVTFSPTFRINNIIRDSLSVMAANPASFNVLKNLAEGAKMTKRGTREYADFLVGGGPIRFGTYLDGDRGEHVKRLIDSGVDPATILNTPEKVRTALTKAWDWWQDVGDRTENLNRGALYKKLRDEGMTHLEASFRARDVIDFSMGGTWAGIRFLIQTVPFMNARLQGLYKLGRGAKENPARFGAVLGGTAMASMALLLAYKDDEDWKRREDYDRESFWWFKIGDLAYRIPKPFEVGAIGSIAERGLEAMISDEFGGKQFADRVFQITQDQLSLNPVPQLFKPAIEVWANRNFFTDRPIESAWMSRLSVSERASDRTSTVAKIVGQAGVLSPVQVDHLISGYFGWLGSHIVATANLSERALSDAPKAAARVDDWFVVGDFVKSLPQQQSRYVTALYENLKETQEAMNDMRFYQATQQVEKMREIAEDKRDKIMLAKTYERASSQLSKINVEVRRIERSTTMDSKLKRERLDALNQMKNDLAESIERRRLSLMK